ncbi:hypothetical protein QR680_001304 [Steinernema hermaphroditum]|uniref:Transducin beta-like protein 2 n=1 Tax=Steinernema hermaphroditum TaxID=289476 RepID=A0AA39LF60_9BILA|nr:hypothetical protein QR680_001304 [Steinernema hermaphroditum]
MAFEESDENLSQIGFLFILVSGLMALVISIAVYTRWDTNKKNERNADSSSEEEEDKKGNKKNDKNIFRKKVKDSKKSAKDSFSHHFLLTNLKGHAAPVLDIDFSSNGKYLVSTCEDRKLLLWNARAFDTNEHVPSVSKVDLDTATRLCFSPDSKSVLVALKGENKLAVYKMAKTTSVKLVPVESITFQPSHTLDICRVGIACTGKYLISASPDNKVVVYGTHGEEYGVIESKLCVLYHAEISPDGRFIGVSGFMPDVFVYEATFTREGQFQAIKKVFELKGHNSSVFSFAFNQDSRRAVTVCKDGFWRLFDTDIRYELGEEAKMISQGEWTVMKTCDPGDVHVAMSPSGKSFAIAANNHVLLVSTNTPNKSIPPVLDIHHAPISSIRISPCGRYIATCGDRIIRIFNNVAEHYSTIVELEQALKEAKNEAARERIDANLYQAKAELKALLKKDHL